MKKNKKRSKKIFSFLFPFLLAPIAFTITSCGSTIADEINTLADLKNKKIAVMSGTVYDESAKRNLPDSIIEYANSIPDEISMLDAGKVSAVLLDAPIARLILSQNPQLKIVDTVDKCSYGFAFQKGNEHSTLLRSQFNNFLTEIATNGVQKQINDTWFGFDDSKKTIPYSQLSGVNGLIKVAICSAVGEPFMYIKDNVFVGYDCDLLFRFALKYGYDLAFEDYFSVTEIVSSIIYGKNDICCSCLSITDYRKKQIDFSLPYYDGGVCVVAKTNANEDLRPSLAQLNGKKVGIVKGSYYDEVLRNIIPSCEFVYVNNVEDCGNFLDQDMIDAYVLDEHLAVPFLEEFKNQTILSKIQSTKYGFAFKKGVEDNIYKTQLDEFLKELSTSGVLSLIDNNWINGNLDHIELDYDTLEGNNGTLKYVLSTMVPFAYKENGKYAGIEVDIATRFCKRFGYKLNIVERDFYDVLNDVESGETDLASACITITEERKERFDFSIPYFYGNVVVVVKSNIVPEFINIQSLTGKTIAVLSGSVVDVQIKSVIDCNVVYVTNISEYITILDSGKVDAFICDDIVANQIMDPNKHYMLPPFDTISYGAIFPPNGPKTPTLLSEFNEFVRECRNDGTLDELISIWVNGEGKEDIPLGSLTGENGVINVASYCEFPPFNFIGADKKPLGYDIELLYLFAKKFGYSVHLTTCDFSAVLSLVGSGMVDLAISSVTITEERKKTFAFSDSYYDLSTVAVVRTINTNSLRNTNIFDVLVDNFKKSFIEENRWIIFAEGILNTLLLIVISLIFGTVLGFCMYLLYRLNNPIIDTIIDAIGNFLEKTPIVIILMILYYVIFRSIAISSIFVGAIGFTILFMFSFSRIMRLSVSTVDRGQLEVSRALGYSDWKAFSRIILPQARPIIVPEFKKAVISLIKDTSIVGYIAAQDITKSIDIIRSRTFDPFFPLIVSGIVYFLIAYILVKIIEGVNISFDTKRRSKKRIMKGITIND